MAGRFLVWLGAGVLTAGVSAATVAGAGVATAQDGAGAATDGNTTSQSTDSTGDKADSDDTTKSDTVTKPHNDSSINGSDVDMDPDASDDPDVAADEEATEAEEATKEQDGAELIADRGKAPDQSTAHDGAESMANHNATDDSDGWARNATDTSGTETLERDLAPSIEEEVDESAVEPAAGEPTAVAVGAVQREIPADTEPTLAVARFAMSAPEAAEAAPARAPTLINIIGTFFFSVFDFFANLVEGPPVIPPGANVTVSRSTLRIDCGDGYLTEADWYFPTESEPDKLIYLQHGAFAQAGLYNVTAAELAERNNAIVVSPTITTNFFACDGCQISGEQMHAAVAKLFLGDRAALLASARAAGFNGTALPQRFVFAGHSGGGHTAAGAAGFYAQNAPAGRLHDMAGVLLLDTSHVGGAVERGVRNIPLDIPVHHIAAAPAVLNTYGGVNEALARVRPGFVGVQLIGGVHADAWRSTNALAEFVVGVATGFSTPQNIEAVQVLAEGWITDWFNNTHTDEFYGDRGEVIPIETPAGLAQAYVIPGPAPALTIIDFVLKALVESTVLLSPFSGNCAVDPDGASTLGVEALNGACRTSGLL